LVQDNATNENGSLYNAAGAFYCSHTNSYNCISAYNLDEIVDTWTCGDLPPVVDLDMDGSLSDVDPDDANPCIPDSLTSICVNMIDGPEGPTTGNDGIPPVFLSDYPWLNDLVDFENCAAASIQVYRSSGYIYLFVATSEKTILYNSSGATYCNDAPSFDCRSFYTVDEEIDRWNCGDIAPAPVDNDGDGILSDTDPDDNDPCSPDDSNSVCEEETAGLGGAPPVFLSDYPWLSDLVDFDKCSSEIIQVYRSNGYVYLFVDTDERAVLYNSTGATYCTNSSTYDCKAFYTVDEEIDLWFCGDTPPEAPIVDEDNDGYFSDVDEDDTNPCIPDDSTEACELLNSDLPPLFEEYTWLSTIVNPLNCTTEKITVYQSGIYQYLLIETANSTILYNHLGLTYCTGSPTYDCVSLYGLSIIVDSWMCNDNLQAACIYDPSTCPSNKIGKTPIAAGKPLEVKVSPNPTTGQFTVTLGINDGPTAIHILNIQGQQVASFIEKDKSTEAVVRVDLSKETKGIYFVKVQSKERVITKRIVVQ